jgi:hypothetical protein
MTIRKSPPDEQGNHFVTKESGNVLTIFLKLNNETREREIGKVFLKERILEIKRNREKHLFRKNKYYGFNEHVVKTGKTFDKIQLSDEQNTYLFNKELILQKGSYLHFKDLGFEKQLFLPLSEMEKFIITPIF